MKVDALRDGITAGANIVRAEERLRRYMLAKQIEKLSWMVEYMSRPEDEGTWAGPNVEEAEEAWHARGR